MRNIDFDTVDPLFNLYFNFVLSPCWYQILVTVQFCSGRVGLDRVKLIPIFGHTTYLLIGQVAVGLCADRQYHRNKVF